MIDIIKCPYCHKKFPLVVVVKEKEEREAQRELDARDDEEAKEARSLQKGMFDD